jgi:hypothetical protein
MPFITMALSFVTLSAVAKWGLQRRAVGGGRGVGTKRTTVVAAALTVAIGGLGGCTDSSRGGSESTTSVAAPELGGVSATVAVLGPGTYIAGQQLASGLYEVTVDSGLAGLVSIKGREGDPLGGIMEVVAAPEVVGRSPAGVPAVRVDIVDGDEVVLTAGARGEFTLAFTPVTSRWIEPVDGLVTVHAGRWLVGDDIEPGRYLAEVGPGQRGLLYVTDGRVDVNLETIELLDGDGSDDGQTSVALDLAVGDRILIAGLGAVTLSPV